MSECLLWTGPVNAKGYGQKRVRPPGWKRGDGPGPRVYVHRHAWEQEVGPIPDGLTLDHLCRNTRCLNVEHMEVVTLAENSRRAAAHRRASGLCSNGHAMTEENTYRSPAGPKCRQCGRDRNKEYRQRVARTSTLVGATP